MRGWIFYLWFTLMKKESWEKDYFDYAHERNMTNLKIGIIIAAIAGIFFLLNNIFHFIKL